MASVAQRSERSPSEKDNADVVASHEPAAPGGGSASDDEGETEVHLTGKGLDRVLSKDMVTQERDAAKSPRVRQHEPPKFDTEGFPVGNRHGTGLKVRPGMPGKWWDDQAGARPGRIPPRYNNEQNAPIDPSTWRQEPKHRSRTALLDARRDEWSVDPSFDLDGDGQVSHLDYFFARQFDRDRDGKLNAEEKAAALEALRQGYADNFVEVKGPARFPAHRVVQRRGAVISEERGAGWAELQRTFSPRALQGGSVSAPFHVTEQDGPASAAEQDEDQGRGAYRHLGHDLDIHSRRDLLRARRMDNSQSMRKKFARNVFRGAGEENDEEDAAVDQESGAAHAWETQSVSSSVDERVKATTGTLDGRHGPTNTSHRGLLRMRKLKAREEAAQALGMSHMDFHGTHRRAQTAGANVARAPDTIGGDNGTIHVDSGSFASFLGAPSPMRAQTATGRNGGGVASLLHTVGVRGTGVEAAFDDDEAAAMETGAGGPTHVRDSLRARARTPPDQLSHSQSELRARRRANQAAHGHTVAPRTGLGIHSEPVPSVEETLSRMGRTWFQERSPETKVSTPWDRGSVLDHPRVGSPGGGFGQVESSLGRRVDARTGKPLIRSGLAGPGEPPACLEETKRRTACLLDLPQVRKRKSRDIPAAPVQMDPWEVLRRHDRPSTVGPPGVRHATRRWTDSVIAYRQAMEEGDDFGSSTPQQQQQRSAPTYQDPAESAPLYSSFAADRIFRDTWNEKRRSLLQPGEPERSRWSSMSGRGSDSVADTGASREKTPIGDKNGVSALASPLQHQPSKRKRKRRGSVYGTPVVIEDELKRDRRTRCSSSHPAPMVATAHSLQHHSSSSSLPPQGQVPPVPQPRQRRVARPSSVRLAQGSGLFHGVKGARDAERIRAARSRALLERCELEEEGRTMTHSESLPAIPLRSPLWSRIQPLESE